MKLAWSLSSQKRRSTFIDNLQSNNGNIGGGCPYLHRFSVSTDADAYHRTCIVLFHTQYHSAYGLRDGCCDE